MLYDKLFPWQKNIIDKFKDRESFGLFLDMGLGKTITSLALAEANDCNKVIVISINAKANESEDIKGSWLNWAKQSKYDYKFYHKWSDFSDVDTDRPELLICNYESLFARGKNNELNKYLSDFCLRCHNQNVAIIIDESHKIKDLNSKQTKAIFKLKSTLLLYKNNVFSYLLSGTPFTTGFIDVYSQLKFLGLKMTKGAFIEAYCIRGQIPGLFTWQQPVIGYKDIDGLYDLIHKYALTVKSEEILDLPEQVFVDKLVPLSKAFKLETYEKLPGFQIRDELLARQIDVLNPDDYNKKAMTNNPFYRNIAFPDLTWLAETSGVFWMRARQASIGFQGNDASSKWYDTTRLDILTQFLDDNRDNYVLFYNYTAELQTLYPTLTKLGYNVDVYCGPIKSLVYYERYLKQIESGQVLTDQKPNIILANFASGSTGMNWQAYHKCIIFSLPLYKDYAQAIKRVHRIGQKETVIYYRFYQDNWLDKGMLQALNEQIQYSEDLFAADLRRIQELTSE